MSKLPDNPAARLHAVLLLAKNINTSNIRIGFATVLGVPTDDLGQIQRLLGFLSAEADEVARLLKTLGELGHYETYIESLPSIKKTVEIEGFTAPWPTFRDNLIRHQDLISLRHCAFVLSSQYSEKTVPEDDLKEWLERVNKLYEEVDGSDMDARLKVLILSSLERIRRGIREYKVRGIKALRDAVFDAWATGSEQKNEELEEAVERYGKQAEKSGNKNAEQSAEYWKTKYDSEKDDPVLKYVTIVAGLATIAQFGIAISPLFAPYILPLLQGR
jgi:hypothetical protein